MKDKNIRKRQASKKGGTKRKRRRKRRNFWTSTSTDQRLPVGCTNAGTRTCDLSPPPHFLLKYIVSLTKKSSQSFAKCLIQSESFKVWK